MKDLKNYLREVLGESLETAEITKQEKSTLPLFMRSVYELKKGILFNKNILLVIKNGVEHFTTEQYRKHANIIETNLKLPVVFVFNTIESYNRKRLIQKQIAFILPGKQMCIPYLLIDLKEYKQKKPVKREILLPAAQCLVLFHLLKNSIEGRNFKEMAKRTNYSSMTITRAANDLAEKKICKITGTRDKTISFGKGKKKIWEQALPYMTSPIKKTFYINAKFKPNTAHLCNISALSNYTNIAGDNREHLAVSQMNLKMLMVKNVDLETNNIEGDIKLEIWKYSPGVLTDKNIVDPLSLYLSLKNADDERVQMSLDKLLNELW